MCMCRTEQCSDVEAVVMAAHKDMSDGCTCEPIQLLGCDPSIWYVDPCRCSGYYKCVNNDIQPSECSEGSLWDPSETTCAHEDNVLLKDNCRDPWSRCNVTETRAQELQAMCTNTTLTTPGPTTTEGGAGGAGDGDGINAGLVVGLIVAGAVLAVIVIAAVFFYRRHKKRTTIKKGRTTIASNPEYFEGGNASDPYDFINDIHMHDPTYQGEPSGFPSNGTLSTSMGNQAEYDNSVSRDAGTSLRYTNTLTTSQQDRELPYDRLTRDNNGNEIADGTRPKLSYENRSFSDDNGTVTSAGDVTSASTSATGTITRAADSGERSATLEGGTPEYMEFRS